jgi:hypothetical protein
MMRCYVNMNTMSFIEWVHGIYGWAAGERECGGIGGE